VCLVSLLLTHSLPVFLSFSSYIAVRKRPFG
jgi:hypothetical protein